MSLKKFISAAADVGCIISGEKGVHLHHMYQSRVCKHNKVTIGPWAVLPLTPENHAKMHTSEGRREFEKIFELENPVRYDLEKYLYAALIVILEYERVLVPDDVLAAIQDYRR